MEKKQIQVFGLRFRWFRLLLHPFYVDFVQYSEIVFYNSHVPRYRIFFCDFIVIRMIPVRIYLSTRIQTYIYARVRYAYGM